MVYGRGQQTTARGPNFARGFMYPGPPAMYHLFEPVLHFLQRHVKL